jgi:hypothetical protein
MRRHGLVLPFLVMLATEASAGSSVQNIGLYDGGNARVVEIQYTGSSGVSFLDALHQPASSLNQDLAMDPSGGSIGGRFAPEPAGILNASVGAIGLVLLVWLRRLRKAA